MRKHELNKYNEGDIVVYDRLDHFAMYGQLGKVLSSFEGYCKIRWLSPKDNNGQIIHPISTEPIKNIIFPLDPNDILKGML